MTSQVRTRGRGISPVVGIVLLTGLVAIAAIGLFVVGTSLTGATQQTVEDRQAGDSLRTLSAEVDRLVDGDDDTATFVIDGSEGSVTSVDPDAGRIEVMIEENGTRTTLYDESLGAVRYESSGTQMAYQAGGIWRNGRGDRSVMVESPRFDYRSSPAPTLTLPVISVRGSASEDGNFEGEITVERRSDVYPAGPDHENPLRADRVIVDVQSSYCSAWSSYVDDRTDGSVVEQCSQTVNTTDGELRVDLPVADLPEHNVSGTPAVNTTVRAVSPTVTPPPGTNTSEIELNGPDVTNGTGPATGPPPNVAASVDPGETTFGDGEVYGLYIEEDVSLDSIGGQIQGSLGSGGTFSGSAAGIDHNGTVDDEVSSTRDPHDDEIQAILDDATASDRVTNFCGSPWGACEFSGPRTIVVDELNFNGGGRAVEFDVSAGNITLLVDGDLQTSPPTNWEITGHESGHSLNVYTTGDLSIGGSVYKTPDASLNPFQPVAQWDDVKDEEYHPEALTFFAPSDSEVSIANGVRIEGSISAPGATTSGGSMSHQQVGAIYIGEWDVASSSLNLYPAPGSYGRPVDGVGPSGSGTLEVTVAENGTGTGLESAVVDVANDTGPVESVDTDAAGVATVEVSPGNYSLAIDRSGYDGTILHDIPVNPNATTEVDVELPATPEPASSGTLRGEIVNGSSSTDTLVHDAEVEVRYAANGTLADSVRTALDGRYDLTLPNGTYDVRVNHTDFNATSPKTAEVAPDGTTWANVSLAPIEHVPTTGSLAVNVTNGTLTGPDGSLTMDGTPVAGASVDVVYPNGTTAVADLTPADGVLVVDDLNASSGYSVNVTHADFQPNEYDGFSVETGGRTTVDVPMRPDGFNASGTDPHSVTDTKLYYLHVSETVLDVEE